MVKMVLGSESAARKSEECPIEDLVGALMESLVDPRLPFSVYANDIPELSVQQAVAKQMHAVVLLYNYFHRKQQPEAEYLDFVAFCKLAVGLRQTMTAFMKFTNQGEFEELNDATGRLSLTEKEIKNACDISVALDSSQDSPDIEGWPISKVAVLLFDSEKENCLLEFGSLTEGVWSLIEKELYDSKTNIEISANETMRKKRKRNTRTSTDGKNADDNAFLQFAFDAVKEVTGIEHSDLVVLETHIVYSLSKEKTAAQFYMMQCSQSISENKRVPVEEVVKSLQGHLVEKIRGSWTSGPVVEYYHMHPYAAIMSRLLSRKGSCLPRLGGSNSQGTKEVMENGIPVLRELKSINEGFSIIDKSFEELVDEDSDRNNKKCKHSSSSKEASLVNISRRTEKDDISRDKFNGRCEIIDSVVKEVGRINPNALNQNDGMDQRKVSTSGPPDEAQETDMDALPKIYHKKKNSSLSTDVCTLRDGVHEKLEMDSLKSKSTQDRDDKVAGENDNLVPLEPNSKGIDEEQNIPASEELQNALALLYRKVQDMSSQIYSMEDARARYEYNIERIRNGGDVDLARKCMKSIISGNDSVPSKTESQDQDNAFQSKGQKALSGAFLLGKSSCQDLEYICLTNNWRFPRFTVEVSDGKFLSKVTLKMDDFELSETGLESSPREARESAAAKIITKLQSMCT